MRACALLNVLARLASDVYVLAHRAVRQDGRVEQKDETITSKLLRNQTTLTRWGGLIYDSVENQESGSPLRRALWN